MQEVRHVYVISSLKNKKELTVEVHRFFRVTGNLSLLLFEAKPEQERYS